MRYHCYILLLITFAGCSTQKEKAPYVSLSSSDDIVFTEFAYSSEYKTIYVMTNQSSWSVISDQEWCEVSKEGAKFTVSAQPNKQPTAPPVATLTVTAVSAPPTHIKVYQAAAAFINILPSDIQLIPADGGEISVSILSNSSWTVLSSQDWAAVDAKSGTGDGSVKISVAANVNNEADEAIVSFYTTGYQDLKKLTIQRAPDPNGFYLRITPSETQQLPFTGGDFTVSINSNTSWKISSTKKWATVDDATGTGDGSAHINISTNPDYESDYATISFITETIRKSLKVTRASNPNAPYISINPSKTYTSPPTGKELTVRIKSNKSWTVSSNMKWAVVLVKKGTGNGSTRISIDANNLCSNDAAKITFTAENKSTVLTIQRDKYKYIREGYGGKTLYYIDGQYIRDSYGGKMIYYIDGQYIRGGYGSSVSYYIDGKHIRDGYGGKTIYYIDGQYIRDGYGGKVLYYLE